MTKSHINPFQVLYVTDSPDPKAFVSLFSDIPIKSSIPIFQEGNVILKGTQGAGKSMLLNLLRPEIRVAYAHAKEDFPVPLANRDFLSAGINLTLSGALDIGQRPLSSDRALDENLFPLLFADFINYFITRDILSSLEMVADHDDVFGDMVSREKFDDFAKRVSAHACWFGFLDNVTDLAALKRTIDSRLAAYRSFHQFNSDLPPTIADSKTRIGIPLAIVHDALKATGALRESVPLFVRIDQLERLYRSDVLRPQLGHEYRRVVNKAIGLRDSRVSYRVGTRRYAWDDDLMIFGTEDRLEKLRDYRVVDLDMRKKEDPKTWIFPEFARDAFRRRLEFAGYKIDQNNHEPDPLQRVFGSSPQPDTAASKYVRKSSAQSILNFADDVPEHWRSFLESKFESSPCEAVLALAWARQRGGGPKTTNRLAAVPPDDAPWNKGTWRKERVRQCLLQIAARNKQRLRWSGVDAIVGISAPNISVFLSVCHEVWDAFLRSEQRKPSHERSDPLLDGISEDIQTVGIQTASREWYEKVAEQPHGHDRQRFVEVLGSKFRKWLIDDTPMSNPGHLGFSLELKELRGCPPLFSFLQDAVDYGDLQDADHTTKNQDRKLRKKWYLAPILSPHFQIPEAHTKEPYYAQLSDLVDWLAKAEIHLAVPIYGNPPVENSTTDKLDPRQLQLFSDPEDETPHV